MGSLGQVRRQPFWRPFAGRRSWRRTPSATSRLLPTLHLTGMIPAMAFTHRLFPLFGIDASFLARADAAGQGAAPVVRKTLAERSDEVRRMLRSRG